MRTRLLSSRNGNHRDLHSFPTRRSSDLLRLGDERLSLIHPIQFEGVELLAYLGQIPHLQAPGVHADCRSEEHTSELQSPCNLVCRLLLETEKERKGSSKRGIRPLDSAIY